MNTFWVGEKGVFHPGQAGAPFNTVDSEQSEVAQGQSFQKSIQLG